MKYSVGYSTLSSEGFIRCIIENKASIEEVYFSWGPFPNGRNLQAEMEDRTSYELLEKQSSDLGKLAAADVPFNLLFNANCYGKDSQSRAFFTNIGNTVDFIVGKYHLSSVTTTSPLIAKFIKNNFEKLKVRASVNMEIGTVEGMEYLQKYFDGYYMKREYNRDFGKIQEMKTWCEEHGKTLHILGNSGCLNHCSAHVFHDNLVAHEHEIAAMDNCYAFKGICHEFLEDKDRHEDIIRLTNFIRPEDVELYEPYFTSIKLATRVSKNAETILKSYVNQGYSGNVLELLEPNHAWSFYPVVIENKKLSNDYLYCDKSCMLCRQCKDNYQNAMVMLDYESQ